MKKLVAVTLMAVMLLTAAIAAAELTTPVSLTFAAQEVGTAAYNYAAALQTVMLKGLP